MLKADDVQPMCERICVKLFAHSIGILNRLCLVLEASWAKSADILVALCPSGVSSGDRTRRV